MKVSCPQCGGNNRFEFPNAFVNCEFCKNSLFIDVDKITLVYSFTPVLESENLELYLKRDFEKVGFDESVEIRDSVPVYFPFWEDGGTPPPKDSPGLNLSLKRGSSHFPEEGIPIPSGEKVFFDSAGIESKNIEICGIDTQPGPPGNPNQQNQPPVKQALYYIPFFQVSVLFNREQYTFFVNAVNGDVHGEPIPFIASDKVSKMFPLFIGSFLFFLVMCSVFNNMLVAIPLCGVGFFLFFNASIQALGKGGDKK
ncbi:MAG: hypothetical protein GY757_44195 [bacterium]|nr:hypothetical protein [bacterium]